MHFLNRKAFSASKLNRRSPSSGSGRAKIRRHFSCGWPSAETMRDIVVMAINQVSLKSVYATTLLQRPLVTPKSRIRGTETPEPRCIRHIYVTNTARAICEKNTLTKDLSSSSYTICSCLHIGTIGATALVLFTKVRACNYHTLLRWCKNRL